MATSLIRIPQARGGTMYAFASAARDITRAFNNPDLKFDFTKYALLDLPDFTDSSTLNGLNTIDFAGNFLEASGAVYNPPTITESNVQFAKTLQNYALNLEELILQDDDFDSVLLQSDAEKIFFKWLAKTGAIRFKSSDSTESVTADHYTESVDSTQTGQNYERVVKYLGSIDAENDIAYNGNTYHEVYVNVPSSVGNTPTVLFKQRPYNNSANRMYAGEFLEGRDGQTHPDPNLDLNSLVDGNDGGAFYDIDKNSTEAVHIDFNEMSYHGIVNDSEVSNFVDFSKKGSNFRFNAVLVYYDLFSVSNPENRATNLYGIMILDNIEGTTGSGSRIHEQIKFKPNEVTGLNGNAFSLKLNIKFNTSLDNVGVETNINDFTTFSMDMFLDTSTILENAADTLLRANKRYSDLADRMEELEKLVLASEEYDEIILRLADLEESFENAAIQLQDSDSLLKLITKAHDKMNSLIDGTIPVELQYNTDVIFNGMGTEVDKSVPGKIKVNNSVLGYTKNIAYLWDINNASRSSMITVSEPFDAGNSGSGTTQYGIWTQLKSFTNRLSLQNLFTSNPNSDLNIYVDDNSFQWKEGHVLKISFETIDMNGNDIIIRTRAKNGFDVIIAELSPSELLSTRPYLEIVCMDPINYTFEVDILR